MRSFSVKEAREHFSKLLDAVSEGEEVIVCRRGKAIAKIVRITESPCFPDRSAFRQGITPAKTPSADIIRSLRDEGD